MQQQTIYEIFRSCRLCGAGGGYKMPIIQNLIDMDEDVPLKDKIRECVHIEVLQDDKMPPLICEHCVDKVNEYYHFVKLCRDTNKQTRQRLGLPMRNKDSDNSDCILGLTEPVYVKCESDDEPLFKGPAYRKGPKHRMGPKSKIGPKSKMVRIAEEPLEKRNFKDEKESKKSLSKAEALTESPKLKGILKKSEKKDSEGDSRGKKRPPEDSGPPSKKTKSGAPCDICGEVCASRPALAAHCAAAHRPAYTEESLACDACGVWFRRLSDAARHHNKHRPYSCARCKRRFAKYDAFKQHYSKYGCRLHAEAPDVVCARCGGAFATGALMEGHRCVHRKTCPVCGVKITASNWKRHEVRCSQRNRKKKKATAAAAAPDAAGAEPPPGPRAAVLVRRCDALLADAERRTRYASGNEIYGLDSKRVYPYARNRTPVTIKQEPLQDGMVSITEDVLDFGGWDSEYSSDGSVEESILSRLQMDSLSNLSLKAVRKSMGKRRAVKDEFGGANDGNDMLSNDISDIINNTTWDDDGDDDDGKRGGDGGLFEVGSKFGGADGVKEGTCDSGAKEGGDSINLSDDKVATENVNVSSELNDSASVEESKESDVTSEKAVDAETKVGECTNVNGSANTNDLDDKVKVENMVKEANEDDTVSERSVTQRDTGENLNPDLVKGVGKDTFDEDLDVIKDVSSIKNETLDTINNRDESVCKLLNNIDETQYVQNTVTNVRQDNGVEINDDSVSNSNVNTTCNDNLDNRINEKEENADSNQKTHSDDITRHLNTENDVEIQSSAVLDENNKVLATADVKANGLNEHENVKDKHLNENENLQEEMYDEQLMRDLNEHIGNSNSSDKNQYSDLRDISDEEFNFDV